MSDATRRSVDDLRAAARGPDSAVSDDLRAAAVVYADACRLANIRLRRCDDYLHLGLRSEAIQFAEVEPPLLDTVAMLDFAERPAWDQLAARHELVAAQPILRELAVELNRAYAEEQPLREQLREHRRLALAGAPLTERLRVVRALKAADPTNPVWPEEVARYESARFRQIGREVELALDADDAAAAAALWDELRYSAWAVPPPRELAERLRGPLVERAAAELHRAAVARDAAAARKIRERMTALTPQLIWLPDDPRWLKLQADLNWLSAEDDRAKRRHDFETAVAALKRALSDSDVGPPLRAAFAAATGHGYKLPADLETRYSDRLRELADDRDRRDWVVVAFTFTAGLVLAFGFVGFLLLRPR